jgi:hypothetical protein
MLLLLLLLLGWGDGDGDGGVMNLHQPYSKVNLQFQLPFVPFPLKYELFVGKAAVGELVAIVAIVVIVASAFVASYIVASCIDASSVGVVEQPQQDVGGGTVVEQLVEVVAGAMDIVAVVYHLAVAVEAFVALMVAALMVAALMVASLMVSSLMVAASNGVVDCTCLFAFASDSVGSVCAADTVAIVAETPRQMEW